MPAGIDGAIVRIWNKNLVVGAGFLVDEGHIMTCAHVLDAAVGRPRNTPEHPEEFVAVDFPLVDKLRGRKLACQVSASAWTPLKADGTGDMAVLELDSPASDGTCTVTLGSATGDLWGEECRTFGFPNDLPNGASAEGEFRMRQGNGWLQVDASRDTQYFVEPGFSGAPAWDEHNRVIGMVITADLTPGVRSAFVIPVETLLEVCPVASALTSPSSGRHVFISYSRKDTAFVEKLEHDLNAQGIALWRDTSSIVGSEDWYNAIIAGLEEAYAVVLVVTQNADELRWVKREALYADRLEVPTVPVWPERYEARLNLEFLLIERQPIYCDGSHYVSGLAQITAKLGELVKAPPPTGRTSPRPPHDSLEVSNCRPARRIGLSRFPAQRSRS